MSPSVAWVAAVILLIAALVRGTIPLSNGHSHWDRPDRPPAVQMLPIGDDQYYAVPVQGEREPEIGLPC